MPTQLPPADLEGVRNASLFLTEVPFWTDIVKDGKQRFRQDKHKQKLSEKSSYQRGRALFLPI